MDRTLGYTLDNAWSQARERLVTLEALADPGSIRHLEALGVGEGWRCLEVGAGAGSIADWLCRRVGPSGFVLATDLDPSFLEDRQQPNLEVRQHNMRGGRPGRTTRGRDSGVPLGVAGTATKGLQFAPG